MSDKRKLLLAAIIFLALYHKVTAVKGKLLDMAKDAVDDQYEGCREQAWKKFIDSGLLEQELNQSTEFKKAWSGSKCPNLIPGKSEQHTAALLAFVNGDQGFSTTFNNAVENLGVNSSTYDNDFHFKSFYFLLMDSMTRYKEECKTVYAEVEYTAKQNSTVRLGRFTRFKSSLSAVLEIDLTTDIILNITSCFFADLGSSICQEESEILLSPAEVFTVEDVQEVPLEMDESYTMIVLKHSKLESSHNCYLLSRSPASVSTQWVLLVLVALSLCFFNC